MGAVGVMQLYADLDEMAEWHAKAAPGEVMIYAIADLLNYEHPAVKLVRRWCDERSAVSVQGGRPGERVYQVQRCSGQDAARMPRIEPSFAATPEGVLFAVLVDLAEQGLPAPSNAQLASQLGWGDREQVRYRLGLLEEAGRVAVRNLGGPFDGRVITIIETGVKTAEPMPQQSRRRA